MPNNKKTLVNIRSLKFWTLIAIVIGSVVLIVFLVTQSDKNDKTQLQPSSLRLKWINQAQFAGYYMAAKNDHYKEAGLKVRIDPAGPNISPSQMVTSGVNEFGIAGADEILQARAKGIPLVALAVLFQENPEALTSLKSSNIKEPTDLIGKRVGVVYGNDENLFRDFLKRNNIDKSQITEIAAVPGGSQLLSNQVDAIMAYSMNVSVLLELQGVETDVMKFSDYGVKFYGDTLFTTEKMLKDNPERVEKFVKATVAGWQDAIDDPKGTTAEVMRINPSLNQAAQLGYLKGVIPLLQKGGIIGASSNATWNNMQDTLFSLGVIKEKVDVSKTYTNQFVSR